MPDWMINIGNWIQNHLYLFMLMVVGVFLIISYFIARHKIKKEKEILEKNKEVDNDPKGEKRFVQGQDVKVQSFMNQEEDNDE